MSLIFYSSCNNINDTCRKKKTYVLCTCIEPWQCLAPLPPIKSVGESQWLLNLCIMGNARGRGRFHVRLTFKGYNQSAWVFVHMLFVKKIYTIKKSIWFSFTMTNLFDTYIFNINLHNLHYIICWAFFNITNLLPNT